MKARMNYIIKQLQRPHLDPAYRYDLEVELERFLNNDKSYLDTFK